jgi:hypothetical protein
MVPMKLFQNFFRMIVFSSRCAISLHQLGLYKTNKWWIIASCTVVLKSWPDSILNQSINQSINQSLSVVISEDLEGWDISLVIYLSPSGFDTKSLTIVVHRTSKFHLPFNPSPAQLPKAVGRVAKSPPPPGGGWGCSRGFPRKIFKI